MIKAPAIYRGRILNPLSYNVFEDIHNGALVVSEGKIIEYGKFKNVRTSGNIVDFGDNVITTGPIDTHIRLPQYDVVAWMVASYLNGLTSKYFQQKNGLNLQKLLEKRQQDSLPT
jgi:cytosine/adenosine deaminase-related metal-dependent hydrolase